MKMVRVGLAGEDSLGPKPAPISAWFPRPAGRLPADRRLFSILLPRKAGSESMPRGNYLESADRLVLSIRIRQPPPSFQLEYGRGYFWPVRLTGLTAARSIFPFPAGMTIVNRLTMEEYIRRGPSEMPSWPAAALEAKAGAARLMPCPQAVTRNAASI